MSNLALKNNLQKILKQKDWSIAKLERHAQLKEQSIQNIFRGISKNPSIELVYAVSKALDISIEELISDKELLFVSDYDAYSEICRLVMQEIKNITSEPVPQKKIFSIIEEIFLYTVNMKNNQVDSSFIKWIVMKNFEA